MALHFIPGDTTNKLIEVMIRQDGTGVNPGQGKTGVAPGSVVAYYIRSGDSANHAIATCAAANLGTYYNAGGAGSGGGWHEVDAINQPGVYQFSVPDAVLAAGVTKAIVTFQISGAIQHRSEIILADKHRGLCAPDALPAGVAGAANGLPLLDAGGKAPETPNTAANLDAKAGDATAASQQTVLNAINAITVNTARSAPRIPSPLVIPETGYIDYEIRIFLYNLQGIPEDADNDAITVHARLADGTSLDASLADTAMSNVGTGPYMTTYRVSAGDVEEAVYFDFAWAIAGTAMYDGGSTQVQSTNTVSALAGIKSQTDKLAFDASNNVLANVQVGGLPDKEREIIDRLEKPFYTVTVSGGGTLNGQYTDSGEPLHNGEPVYTCANGGVIFTASDGWGRLIPGSTPDDDAVDYYFIMEGFPWNGFWGAAGAFTYPPAADATLLETQPTYASRQQALGIPVATEAAVAAIHGSGPYDQSGGLTQDQIRAALARTLPAGTIVQGGSIDSLLSVVAGINPGITIAVHSLVVGRAPHVDLVAYEGCAFGPFSIQCTEVQTGQFHQFAVWKISDPKTRLHALTTQNGEIAVDAADGTVVRIEDDDTLTGEPGVFAYRLVNLTLERVVCQGTVTIEAGPV